MSQFTGPQHRGAMKERRAEKRREAEQRDAVSEHRPTGRREREALQAAGKRDWRGV